MGAAATGGGSPLSDVDGVMKNGPGGGLCFAN